MSYRKKKHLFKTLRQIKHVVKEYWHCNVEKYSVATQTLVCIALIVKT